MQDNIQHYFCVALDPIKERKRLLDCNRWPWLDNCVYVVPPLHVQLKQSK
jgi:hypothetical protein